MEQEKDRILIVEDDEEIRKLLTHHLEENGYQVTSVEDGQSASIFLKRQSFDLILMDMMLPHKNGDELIKELREYSQVPVIVISALSLMETRLKALRMGADDYMIKPFDLDEVLVRIEVVLRRSRNRGYEKDESQINETEGEKHSTRFHQPERQKPMEYGGLMFFPEEHRVLYGEREASLTGKECRLLEYLIRSPGRVFSKANLYELVWEEDYIYEDNTINVHISNLRGKIKKIAGQDYIETVWGIGYRLRPLSNQTSV